MLLTSHPFAFNTSLVLLVVAPAPGKADCRAACGRLNIVKPCKQINHWQLIWYGIFTYYRAISFAGKITTPVLIPVTIV